MLDIRVRISSLRLGRVFAQLSFGGNSNRDFRRQTRLDLETGRCVAEGLRHPGNTGQLEPASELLQGTVAIPGIVVDLQTLQRPGEHGLPAQLGQGVVLQLQPLQGIQTEESIVPETSTFRFG